MTGTAVGIDLGTSNSCVAVRRGDAIQVLRNAYGESTTASVVFIAEDGSVQVGNAARANVIHAPERTISSAKRLIGRNFFSEEVKKAIAICSYDITEGENHAVKVKVGEDVFSLPEISAMILREMKSIAEASLGEPVTKAVITVPAFFNDNQRQATRDAGQIAGLEVLRILNEPTAAALAYGFGREMSQRVAVYDLGGGTFDISVLDIGDDVFEVLATCGDTFLGGDDFDDRLIDLLADEFLDTHGINLRNDRFALEKLKVGAESAKKALSVDAEVEIRIPDIAVNAQGESQSIVRMLGIKEYTGLVQDLVMRTVKVCDEALQQAGVVARDLDGVILVGGPTRLPLIRDAVRNYFQQEPKTGIDPDEAVAVGAAIHAASLVNPDSEAYLLDVTPLSLRIGIAGGLAETIIERNTPVPIEQTRSFTTFKDYQESVDIRIFQGESREASGNELLGQFVFSGFEKALRGKVGIDVTFEINADGIVNVRARDRTTGEEASTRITLSTGLSQSEIEKIIEDGRTDRVGAAPASALHASALHEGGGTRRHDLRRDATDPGFDALDGEDDDDMELELLDEPTELLREQDSPSDPIPGLIHQPTRELFDSSGAELSEPLREDSTEDLLPEPEDLDAFEDVELDLSLDLGTLDDPGDEAQTDPMLSLLGEGDLEVDLFEEPGTDLRRSDEPETGA